MSGVRKTALMLVVMLLATGGYLWRDRIPELVQRARAFVEGETATGALTATGTVEITTVDVAGKMAGYIALLSVDEGDVVTSGDLMARIDRPDLRAQIERDRAALRQAEAVLADLSAGARQQEINEAYARVDAASARLRKAEDDLGRFQKLYDDKIIPRQQMEEVETAYRVAKNELTAAKEREKLVRAGTRTNQLKAQREAVAALKAGLAVTASMLADTELRAPLSGVILRKGYEQGEFLPVGGVAAQIGNLEDCWVRVYVASTYLGFLKLGDSADVRIDAYPDRVFPGTISDIATEAEFTPRQSINKDERANLVFRVKVRLTNREGIMKPGMPADVVFR